MIDAASKLQRRSALYRARAGALVVSHALTTLRPAEALALRWERLQPWPVAVDGLARLEEGRRPVIAELALSVLRTLWNLHGRPSSGEVFKSREGSHLAGRYASELLNEVFAAAALPPIDRRHLRAPLLWWLVHVVGWDLLPVGWAAGFRPHPPAEELHQAAGGVGCAERGDRAPRHRGVGKTPSCHPIPG